MDIALIAQEKINKFVTDGTVDQMIENQIKKTLESTVTDVFRDYSDFGKDLKKTISEKLKVNLEEIDIPTYSNIVCKVIQDTLMTTSLESSIAKIKATVEQFINQIEKKTWKLSEIIKNYLKDVNYREQDAVYEVKDPEYSSYWVYIGSKKEKSSYLGRSDYDVRILVNTKTNVISNVWYENKPLTGLTVNKNWGFDGFLMSLWINECVLEIDEDESDEACIRENECHC